LGRIDDNVVNHARVESLSDGAAALEPNESATVCNFTVIGLRNVDAQPMRLPTCKTMRESIGSRAGAEVLEGTGRLPSRTVLDARRR
jgi:hypothetical protein